MAQEPEPTTFADVPVPMLTHWVLDNALTVDPLSPDGRTFIYAGGFTPDPNDPETGSIAFIPWSLDDGSGRAPGLQVVTDDPAFPVVNCIMASGESPLFEGVSKTCSDPRGSSKRYFLEITEADEAIDLVFGTGVKDIRYKGIKDPEDDGGAELDAFRDEFGIGRIYRVLQKIVNDTDERIIRLRVELGTGVGAGFVPLTFDDDGVAFEMRTQVPRQFFVGSTGAGPRDVWDPDRFATFSPKMFDSGARPRFAPGFFDHEAAGMFPPQDFEGGEKSQYIDSGAQVDGLGRQGSITPNYFDMPENQAAGAGLTGTLFGYLLPESIAPVTIGRHDDGDPEAEPDTVEAWWDGENWRLGLDDDFAVVPIDQLQQWATLLLGRDFDDSADVGPERFGSEVSDDLSALNMDVYIHVGEDLVDANGDLKHDTITLRLTTESVPPDTIFGTATPEWALPGNEAPPLSSYLPADGVPVAINDFASTVGRDPVTIDVLANDLLDGGALPAGATFELVDLPVNGDAQVNPDQTVTYTANPQFFGTDTFTYRVTFGGEVSNKATVSVNVVAPPVPNAPVANNDSAVTTETDPVTIDVLANDTLDGGPIPDRAVVELRDRPVSGTAVVNADNTITYTADADSNFTFTERFTYTVTVDGVTSNPAMVTVRADALHVDDPIAPVALNDSASTVGTTPVTIDVLANDSIDGVEIPEDATVTLISAPLNGSAEVNADNTVTYVANEGFSGQDAFTYRVSVDGVESNTASVTVAVSRPDDPVAPVARNDSVTTTGVDPVTIDVLANDSVNGEPIPAGATVTLLNLPGDGTAAVNADNTISYRARAGFSGTDTFTYAVTMDGAQSNAATVTVTVLEAPPADPPAPPAGGGGGGGFGCSVGSGNASDPMLPGMLVIALIALGLRRRRLLQDGTAVR